MAKRTAPLELVLRAHGPCELLNADGETLWASDSDDDFREEFNNEFLEEEDIGDILDFLVESDILSDDEANKFTNQQWPFNIEMMDTEDESMNDPGDDDDNGENEEFD